MTPVVIRSRLKPAESECSNLVPGADGLIFPRPRNFISTGISGQLLQYFIRSHNNLIMGPSCRGSIVFTTPGSGGSMK